MNKILSLIFPFTISVVALIFFLEMLALEKNLTAQNLSISHHASDHEPLEHIFLADIPRDYAYLRMLPNDKEMSSSDLLKAENFSKYFFHKNIIINIMLYYQSKNSEGYQYWESKSRNIFSPVLHQDILRQVQNLDPQ